jgi:hypothetical protein
MMHKSVFLLGAAAALAACGQSSDNAAANQAAANSAPPKKRAAYCFFKDAETKGWSASRGKDGNVVVKGKVYRQDARYKAVLGEPTVTGTAAEIAPSIGTNDTGYAAPDDWWAVSASIPNSAAVATVTVKCGEKTLADLNIAPKS